MVIPMAGWRGTEPKRKASPALHTLTTRNRIPTSTAISTDQAPEDYGNVMSRSASRKEQLFKLNAFRNLLIRCLVRSLAFPFRH